MARILIALLIGLVFGTGIAISGMANPAKILNFFDFFGTWDPSLAFVMGAALIVTVIGYRIVFRRKAPVFDNLFHLPKRRDIDIPLIVGASVFGIGWGIAGFCPGGAIPALGLGHSEAWIFVGSMIGGIVFARFLRRSLATSATAKDL